VPKDAPRPVYELQLLEGPQMKARKMFEKEQAANERMKYEKPNIIMGSVYRTTNYFDETGNMVPPPVNVSIPSQYKQ